MSTVFMLENIEYTDPAEISNAFNTFFTRQLSNKYFHKYPVLFIQK